jgi:hypothetical protein
MLTITQLMQQLPQQILACICYRDEGLPRLTDAAQRLHKNVLAVALANKLARIGQRPKPYLGHLLGGTERNAGLERTKCGDNDCHAG